MDLARSNKDAMFRRRVFKVSLAMYGSIVLAVGCVEADADPHAGSEGRLTDEADGTLAELGDLYPRADAKGKAAAARHDARSDRLFSAIVRRLDVSCSSSLPLLGLSPAFY